MKFKQFFTNLLLLVGINFDSYGFVGANITSIAGATKSSITALATRDEEVLWEHKVVQMAASLNPFADHMTGPLGSGKPIIIKNDTKKVAGTTINISTVDPFGAPMVAGATERSGKEEQVKPGDFQLIVNIGWFGAGITNTGKAQTIIGESWDEISQEGLAERLAKQQGADAMQNLKTSAASFNTILPNGKTIDTLGTADTYSYALVVASGGRLRDIGARPINAVTPTLAAQGVGKVSRHLHFTSDANARPIKTDSSYLDALKFAKDRGENNNLFTGDYSDVDNNIIYPWQVIQHGGYGSIGAVIQPDAILGTPLLGIATASGVLPAGSGILDGGGSAANAAVTPLRNYFENWSLYAWQPINGVSTTYTPRATYGYGLIQDATSGKWLFFSYTGNTGNTLTGVVVTGSSATGNYVSAAGATQGSVVYNTAPWLLAPDNAGYLGYSSSGAAAAGSKMYECNSKGVPLAFGYGLGEMALVCGYGRIPTAGGGFKNMINRTEYIEPHGRAYSKGIEICYGTAAFVRPDQKTPNFNLQIFARKVDGLPVIA